MKFKRTRLIDRSTQPVRDLRLFLIATEGANTEPRYFRGLQERDVINRSRVKLEIIRTPTDTHASAPEHVLGRLTEFERAHSLEPFDERWLVLDVDRWLEGGKLARVCTEARQRGYEMAISNPCFEVWLTLHVSADLTDLAQPAAAKRRFGELGGWSEPNKAILFSRDGAREAVARAQALETDEQRKSRWPEAPGTRVGLLVGRLLAF